MDSMVMVLLWKIAAGDGGSPDDVRAAGNS